MVAFSFGLRWAWWRSWGCTCSVVMRPGHRVLVCRAIGDISWMFLAGSGQAMLGVHEVPVSCSCVWYEFRFGDALGLRLKKAHGLLRV